jgi:hypothetical protein
MSKAEILIIGTTVKFNTYGNIDNVNEFQGEVVGMFAGKNHPFPATAKAQHSNIYPSLPDAVQVVTPNDFRQYNFVTIQLIDGSKVNIGLPWIIDSSLVTVIERSANIVLTKVSDTDAERLRKVLTQAGYEVKSVDFITG